MGEVSVVTHMRGSIHTPPSTEVLQVLAEDLSALSIGEPPDAPRLAPTERIEDRPLEAALDRLERCLSFDESHEWILTEHPALENFRPVDVIAAGRYAEVFALIEREFAI